MVDVQTIGVLVTATSVSLAAIYYIINIINTNKARQTQTFLSMHQNYMNMMNSDTGYIYDHFKVKDYSEFVKIFEDKDSYKAMSSFMAYFEGVGVLVRENVLTLAWLRNLFLETL
jgi:hypothetical protein